MYTKFTKSKLLIQTLFFLSVLSLFDFNYLKNNIFNYLFIIIGFFSIFLFIRKNINPKRKFFFYGSLCIIFIFLIHSLISTHTDGKHVLNQIGFSFVILTLSLIIDFPYYTYRKNFYSIYYKLLIISSFILALCFFNLGHLKLSYNHLYFQIYKLVGLDKQQIGALFMWTTSAIMTVIYFKKTKSYIHYIFLLIIIFTTFGIRSLILSLLILLFYYLYINSFLYTKYYRYVLFFIFLIPMFILIELPPVFLFDVRGLMLSVTMNSAYDNFLGIGIAGYVDYLNDYFLDIEYLRKLGGDDLLYLKNDDFKLKVLESDILVLIMSFGCFIAGLYYFFSLSLIEKFFFNRELLGHFEIFSIILFSQYIFSGLTQDWMFKLHWWIMILFVIISTFNMKHYKRSPKRIIFLH